MKFNDLTKKRVSIIVAFAFVLSCVAGYSESNNDKTIENKNNLIGAASNVVDAGDLATPDVTAGVTDVLTDSATVGVTDTGVGTVAQPLDEQENPAEDKQVAADEASAAESEETAQSIAEICGYENLGMSSVKGNLNVRKEATTNSKIVGKMTNNNACEILDTDGDWTKVKSGSVTGYVKSEYLVTGEDAIAAAEKAVVTVATIKTTTLRVRRQASTDSTVVSLVGNGEDLTVEAEEDGWYKVEVDDQNGYISGEYVDVSQKLPTATSIKELSEGSAEGGASKGVSLVHYALQFVGNRYVWGGTSLTGGVDCSGFTMQVYKKYGISLPHHAASQPSYGTRVSASSAKPGDLFFYGNGRGINHVAIYIGNGQVVHASNPRSGIKISNAFYRRPVCVVRYLK